MTGSLAFITWLALAIQFVLQVRSIEVTGFSFAKAATNFFSYFTVLSNILVAVTLTSELLSPRSFMARSFVQAAIAVFIFIVGLVYNLVLRTIWSPEGWQLLADNLLHVVVPVLYLLYWVLFSLKRSLGVKHLGAWLIFPACYLGYSLIRGKIADWYPYPFLNTPDLGYQKVLSNSAMVLVSIIVTSLLILWINNRTKLSRSNEAPAG